MPKYKLCHKAPWVVDSSICKEATEKMDLLVASEGDASATYGATQPNRWIYQKQVRGMQPQLIEPHTAMSKTPSIIFTFL